MTLATYAGLIAEIWADLEKTQVTDLAESWISAVESRLNAELRVRQMVERDTATISNGFSSLPDDFMAVRQLRLTDSPYTLLQYLTQEQMAGYKATLPTGTLAFYTLVGSEFEYGPVPDGTSVTLTYYAQVPALTVSNTSNWLLAAYPLAYKRGALVEAGLYYRDNDLATTSEQLFQTQLQAIRRNSLQAEAFNLTPTPSAFAV